MAQTNNEHKTLIPAEPAMKAWRFLRPRVYQQTDCFNTKPHAGGNGQMSLD